MASTLYTDNLNTCSGCKTVKPKLLTCTSCHCAQYCDRACQKKAWGKHKELCLLQIGRLYIRMAENEDHPRGFVLAKDAYGELLRLTKKDNQYVRCIYPFVLLELGELQAAFDCIKYWEAVDAAGHDVDKVEPLPITKELWRYPHAEGIFDDMLKYNEPKDGYWNTLETWILLAGLLIRYMFLQEFMHAEPDSYFVRMVLTKGKSPEDVSEVQTHLLVL